MSEYLMLRENIIQQTSEIKLGYQDKMDKCYLGKCWKRKNFSIIGTEISLDQN